MDPLSLAFGGMGLIGNLIGGQQGARASREANEMNMFLNMLNFQQREDERREARDMAERNRDDLNDRRREQQLGFTDEKGNATRFIPGVGWVSTQSGDEKAWADEQRGLTREQMEFFRKQMGWSEKQMEENFRRLAEEQPLRSQRLSENFRRQSKEGRVAEGLLEEFRDVVKEDPTRLQDIIASRSIEGINRAFDDTAGDVYKKGLRTGASNTGKIIADIGRKRSEATGSALRDAFLQARGVTENEYNTKRNAAANLYGAFAGRASGMPDSTYNPTNLPSTFAQQGSPNTAQGLTQAFMSGANQFGTGGDLAVSSAGKAGGTMSYMQPDMGGANMWASFGSALNGFGNRLGSSSDLANRRRGNSSYGSGSDYSLDDFSMEWV